MSLVDQIANAVDAYIRKGGADYEELSDVIQGALADVDLRNAILEEAAAICQAHADAARQYTGDEADQDVEVGEKLAAEIRALKKEQDHGDRQ